MTAQEILTAIEAADISVSDFAYGNFGCPNDFELPEPLASNFTRANDCNREMNYVQRNKIIKEANQYWLKSIGVGEWEEVQKKGGEDQGPEWFSIKYFKDHDVYIKTEGWYQSHHGTDFDDGYGQQVFPKQKTITVYE